MSLNLRKWSLGIVLVAGLAFTQLSRATCPPGEMPESGECCAKCEARCEANGGSKSECQKRYGSVGEEKGNDEKAPSKSKGAAIEVRGS